MGLHLNGSHSGTANTLTMDNSHCASSKWPQRLKPWELKRVIIGEFQWTQSSLFPDFDWRIVKWAKLSWAEPPAGRRKHSSTCLLSSALQSTMCSQHKLQSIMWLCSQQIAVYSVLQPTHDVRCVYNVQSTLCSIAKVRWSGLAPWGEGSKTAGGSEPGHCISALCYFTLFCIRGSHQNG